MAVPKVTRVPTMAVLKARMRHRGHTVEVTIGTPAEEHDISPESYNSPENGARAEALLTQSEVLEAIRVGSVGTAPGLSVHELVATARAQSARQTRTALEKDHYAELDTVVAALKDNLEKTNHTIAQLRANVSYWRRMSEARETGVVENTR